jgi:hypothetical protein
MSNSEIIEEILYDAYKRGIEKEIFEVALGLMSEGKEACVAYEEAHKRYSEVEKIKSQL